ncbi:MAG: hypothetical protein RIC55_07115 [Pirellulaceae bacterium]
MAYRLPILTFATLVGVTLTSASGQVNGASGGAGQGGAAPGSASVAGGELVSQAARRLRDVPLSAKLRFEINMMGQQLSGGEGSRYSQLGRGSNRLRFELKLGVGQEQVASLVQVCNGEHLYVRRALPGQTKVTRVRVDAVLAAIDAARQASPESTSLDWLAIGGLPRLLQVLHSALDFGPPKSGRYGDQKVWIVKGTWKPEMLAHLLPNQREDVLAGKPARLEELAPHVPTHVTIAFGADGQLPLFPHFVEYRRQTPQGESTPLVTLKFFDVKRRADLTPEDFDYEVTETAEVIDNDEQFILGLGLQPVK